MASDPQSENDFTFIQMNFWEGRMFYPLIKFFNREQPHILSVQELLTGSVLTNPSNMTQESIMDQKFFEQVSEGKAKPMFTRANGVAYDMRCATFTNAPAKVIASYQMDLYLNPDDASEKEARHAEYAGLLHTVVELNDGRIVNILNHHGRLQVGARMGHPAADYNFKKIAEYAATLKGGIILSGDFNIVKEAPSLQPLKDIGLTNLNDVYGITEARNEFSWKEDEAVSHIFINDEIMVHEYRIPTDNISDHLALVLRFGLNK